MSGHDPVAIVLAAGLGTRMKSNQPKVLQLVAHRTMLEHVLKAAHEAGIERHVIVTAPGMDEVRSAAERSPGSATMVVQEERKGTGHAVLTARPQLDGHSGPVVVLFGDTPLIRPETISAMMDGLRSAEISVLGFRPPDPTGYGRMLTDDGGQLVAIREHADATPEEREVDLCFSGLMAFAEAATLSLLDRLTPNNAQGEFYLTDVISIARNAGCRISTAEADPVDVLGADTRAKLAAAEMHMQERLRLAAMEAGVGMMAPETVFLSHDTRIGRDTIIEPHVIFGPGVEVGEGVLIRGYSHLEGTSVGDRAQIGPFARLRPGAEIGSGSKVGNFVEIKNTTLGDGAKANHLSYLGDAHIGPKANIGAGTITCNYDGFFKYQTTIGAGAFVGSNSALIAPVTVGEGAYVGSGSVVVSDIENGALAIARARQETKPGWAAKFRKRQTNKRKT